MVLKEIRLVKGVISLESGLHIGGSSDALEIGGVDNEVVKHPITGEPYIPGSSLKGRMRSLLERKLGKIDSKGNPCNCGRRDCDICLLFGAHKRADSKAAPPRLLFRDAKLTEQTRDKFKKFIASKGKSYLEIKAENTIDRKSGAAIHPRFIERVPAGAKFDFEIAIQVFDQDNIDELLQTVKDGLNLVENTYLGGSGSRGYGKVKFDFSVESISI
ncbi:MAG TPA: type III-A CRISPR-associated RAMP protein Csm3 [Aequorivita sp.]|nr:type III-A CRISPR-associated RAMP protein Csm3 [Aequorivita sp.]